MIDVDKVTRIFLASLFLFVMVVGIIGQVSLMYSTESHWIKAILYFMLTVWGFSAAGYTLFGRK